MLFLKNFNKNYIGPYLNKEYKENEVTEMKNNLKLKNPKYERPYYLF